jgi:hypothetical protein
MLFTVTDTANDDTIIHPFSHELSAATVAVDRDSAHMRRKSTGETYWGISCNGGKPAFSLTIDIHSFADNIPK